ncbi:MAG: hypothetical protein AUG45_13780 [Ktedonobacter sp. 13_1_20CM_3_54_15]|nr:MAG: hypothetical protein AUH05_21905 [Ktedonobacter sp. 13_2_20CM_53_11]OLB63769.1 MAG: hypothetical protein AUH94_03105 [Ktedonobacter sp. 13_2_20CM_2_54_8]OLE31209.1 MAG: hypothetical protein AUG45_13780 [Ktedonobacter sp. 13_1_20CM_3_54_15]
MCFRFWQGYSLLVDSTGIVEAALPAVEADVALVRMLVVVKLVDYLVAISVVRSSDYLVGELVVQP